jgi:lambda repressor-like predicted transcriptional regulator
MKSAATPPDRTIRWISKFDLAIHPTVAQTPEDRALVELLTTDWAAKLARGVPPERLISDPLEVTPENDILDGRHRFLAAMRLPGVELLPYELIDDEATDPETLVCEKLLQRRHYSKSARAYALRHMAAAAAQAGREAVKSNLMGPRQADGSYRKPIESAFGKKSAMPIESARQNTLASLAAKSNLSVDILQQAVKLEASYMVKADKLIADWLALNPDDAASWQAFQDANPSIEMPWSCWRVRALFDAYGIKDDAASIHTIPKHWREIEEDKIFNGIVEKDGEDDDRRSYSLGSALKAMGSYFATAGQPRGDLNGGSSALHLTLLNKLTSFGNTMWARWADVDPAGRMEVIKGLATNVITWPEDARRALAVALSKEAAK